MLPVALAIGVGHVEPSLGDGRHAHQRIAQPLLPDRFAVQGKDLQLAALGVEGDVALGHHGRGGTVIAGPILPKHLARLGVEGIELVAAEAAADEELSLDDGRGGQGMVAWNRHFPAFPLAVLRRKRLWGSDLQSRAGPLGRLLCCAERIVGRGLILGRGLHGRLDFTLASLGFTPWASASPAASHASPTNIAQNRQRTTRCAT